MLNPLDLLKQSLLTDIKVLGKTFTFDTSKPIKSLNKVEILTDILVAVEKLNLEDFSTIKEGLEKGLTLEQAKKQEIESWEPEIINILVQKYLNIIKDKKPIDFKNLPDLRIYWKLRKIFSKEEIDNFSQLDYDWAVYNLQQDEIDKDEFDHGRTRNIILKTSEADYILYLTDDAVPCDEKLASNMISAFDEYNEESSRVAATFAKQIAFDDAKLKEKFIREYNYPDYDVIKDLSKEQTLGIKNYFLSNVCAMYDRATLIELGGFEEDIILNEDTFFAYAAIHNGYKIVYKAEARVYHSHNYTYMTQFNRNFDIGVSQKERHEIFAKIPSEKEGTKLLKTVLPRFLKELKFIEAIDFIIECTYRYFGYKKGYNFEKLSIDTCIKYASNKEYFVKKKENA